MGVSVVWWLSRPPHTRKVAGSSPARNNFGFASKSYCFSTSSLMDNQLESLCKALDCLFSFLVSDFDYFPLITLLGRVGNFQLYCTVPIVVLSASTMNSRHS